MPRSTKNHDNTHITHVTGGKLICCVSHICVVLTGNARLVLIATRLFLRQVELRAHCMSVGCATALTSFTPTEDRTRTNSHRIYNVISLHVERNVHKLTLPLDSPHYRLPDLSPLLLAWSGHDRACWTTSAQPSYRA